MHNLSLRALSLRLQDPHGDPILSVTLSQMVLSVECIYTLMIKM